MRIDEINARLAAISVEAETAEGETLSALNTEADALMAERKAIVEDIEARKALRSRISSGVGVVAQTATTPKAAEPTTEEAEMRSFAEFVRGNATQMRSGEQNFSMTNNAAIIPATIAQKIIDKVTDLCPILAGAEVYHVKGTLKIPVWGNANSTHNINVAYGTEFSDLTADSGAFTSVDLSGYLVGVLTLVGKSVINSADIDVVNFIVDKMAAQIAAFVEGELLNGTTNKCTGALSSINTMNAGSTSAVSADNLIDLQAKVKQAYQQNACWTMHPATFTAIKKLKDSNNRYLVQDDFSGEFPYRLLGKPVYLSDNMPTIASAAKAILYGDYSGMAVNIREDVSIEVLREKYATQHAVGICGWMEIDSKVQNAQKLAVLVMST